MLKHTSEKKHIKVKKSEGLILNQIGELSSKTAVKKE